MENIVDRNGNVIPNELWNIEADVELITSDRAKELLSVMAKNRKIRRGQINKYKTDLKNNMFTFCPNPIILNQNGEMIDGQHRCSAVVETDKPFWCVVLYNVPEDVVIDRGAPRKTGEELYMRGILDNEMSKLQYTGLSRAYLRLKNGVKDITDTQIGRFINQYQEEIYEAYSLSLSGSHGTPLCRKAGVQAALFAALTCGVDYDRLREFAKIVNSGFATSEKDSAAILLRNYLQSGEKMTGTSAIDHLCAYTEMAIADYMSDKPRHRKYKDLRHVYIDKSLAGLEEAC